MPHGDIVRSSLPYTHRDPRPDAVANSHTHPIADSHAHSVPNSHAAAYGDTYLHTHGYTYADSHGHAYTVSHAISRACSHVHTDPIARVANCSYANTCSVVTDSTSSRG